MRFQRFLSLVAALRQTPGFPVMDAVEERMLHAMATVWQARKRLTVMEAMHMFQDISPSTAHRRLKTLRAKGLIELAPDQADSRVKYVQATRQAEDYFARMERCMREALS